MKKRVTLLTLALVLIFSLILTGCGPKEAAEAPKQEVEKVETPVETPKEETKEEPKEQNAHVSKDGVDYYAKYNIVDNGSSVSFTDSRGKTIEIPKNPKKVANLYNSYLSLWDLLGGKIVAAVEQADEKPVDIGDAELVGKPADPNLEKIVEIDPDFVVIAPFSKNKEVAEKLDGMGIPTIYVEIKSKDDYYRLVRLFSAILENEEGFEKYALDMEEKIQELIAKVPKGDPQKVLLMMSTQSGVNVKNNQSINGEMLTDLHTINIADNAVVGDKSEEFSLEQIVSEDPDVIFMTEMGSDLEAIAKKRSETLETDPVWGDLSAVKNGRYHVLPKDLFTYKPNENYLEAYTILAKYLYPDVFGK